MINTSDAFRAVPVELRERAQWVVWRREWRNDKTTKVPYRPADAGKLASATDPSTWGSFAQAVSVYQAQRADGIGFVFSDDDPYCGVDLDHCRDASTGALEAWAQDIVERLASYTEISPSGTGLHIIARGSLPTGGNRKGRVEMYDRQRFFCVTGLHQPGSPETIEDRQNEIEALHGHVFGKSEVATDGVDTGRPGTAFVLDDRDVLRQVFESKNGARAAKLYRGDKSDYGNDDSLADFVLCDFIAQQTSDPGQIERLLRGSKLARPKWDERRGDTTWLGREIEKALAKRSPTARTDERYRPFALSLPEYGVRFGAGTEERWAVEGWLPPRDVALLVGPPKNFKSWLLYDLAISVAGGFDFLGLFRVARSGPVLIINQEDKHETVLARLALIQAAREHALEVFANHSTSDEQDEHVAWVPRDIPIHVHPWRGLRFGEPAAMEQLHEWIARLRPVQVIIDPLVRATSTDDYMQKAESEMQALKRWRDEYGCGFVIAHHTKKDESGGVTPWGSQFLEAFRETKWTVRRTGTGVVRVERSFRDAEEPEPVGLAFEISTDSGIAKYSVEEVDLREASSHDLPGAAESLVEELRRRDASGDAPLTKAEGERVLRKFGLGRNDARKLLNDRQGIDWWLEGPLGPNHAVLLRLVERTAVGSRSPLATPDNGEVASERAGVPPEQRRRSPTGGERVANGGERTRKVSRQGADTARRKRPPKGDG